MKQEPISPALFIRNRSKLAEMMTRDSILVVEAGVEKNRTADQFYPFRPDSNFYYLTGESRPGSVLVFYPDHPDEALREQLFIRKPDEKSELWTGSVLSQDETSGISGISQVRWLHEKEEIINIMLPGASLLYAEKEVLDAASWKGLSILPLMEKLRCRKEPEEIEQIKRAVEITRSAFYRVLDMLKPGVMEYQVEAELIGEFTALGAQGHAFEPIIASGRNALVLHYIKNRGVCRDRELLLMDFGAEVNNYAADCSRTLPVNGRFTPRQRELYDATLHVFREASKRMIPGKLMSEFHREVGEIWAEEHIKLGLYSRDELNKSKDNDSLWKKYFMHGTSHSLGLDVHDLFNRNLVFEPGMVFTCEPGIYVAEEGIGIRLENDLVITENGVEDLMEGFPMDADEIEHLMNN